ncbi:MAG: hypothetical protein ABIU05_15250 [Nitrospirales bacterium]
MHKWTYLIAAAIVASTANPLQALDLSSLTGTTEVQFQPMQSAGIKEGCTLVYRAVGRDYTNRKGNLISLAGNVGYQTNKQRNNVVLSLKIGMIDSLDHGARPEAPFFAYLQSPHGTTAKSELVQFDSPDMPGFRVFVYELDEDVLKVYKDIVDGVPVTIGFNRRKGGLDVLVPLDLNVAESMITADGSIKRRRSNEMLLEFLECVTDVTEQAQKQLQGK